MHWGCLPQYGCEGVESLDVWIISSFVWCQPTEREIQDSVQNDPGRSEVGIQFITEYKIEILLNFSCETSSNTPASTSFLSGSGETSDFIDLTLKYWIVMRILTLINIQTHWFLFSIQAGWDGCFPDYLIIFPMQPELQFYYNLEKCSQYSTPQLWRIEVSTWQARNKNWATGSTETVAPLACHLSQERIKQIN